MPLVHRYQLPEFIRRGVDETLTLDVFDAATQNQQSTTAGTVSVFAGSKIIVDEATVTIGAPTTYTLLGTTTTGEELSDFWQVRWTVTIGGATHQFRRRAYLVRLKLDPVIIDDDLTALHSDLLELRDLSQNGFATQRDEAWILLNRWLLNKGNRPQLVMDAAELRDAHRYKALELIFRDFGMSAGDGRYKELEDKYRDLYHHELDTVQFTYDFEQDGNIDGLDTKQASPVTFLSSSWGWWNRYY